MVKGLIRRMMGNLAYVGIVAAGLYAIIDSSPSEPAYEQFEKAVVCNVSDFDINSEKDFTISYFDQTPENKELFYERIRILNRVGNLKDLEGKVNVKIPCLVD